MAAQNATVYLDTPENHETAGDAAVPYSKDESDLAQKLQHLLENDAEREHTFEHAEWVNRIAQEWYRRCGYQVLEIPMVSVDERCAFVLQTLANNDA